VTGLTMHMQYKASGGGASSKRGCGEHLPTCTTTAIRLLTIPVLAFSCPFLMDLAQRNASLPGLLSSFYMFLLVSLPCFSLGRHPAMPLIPLVLLTFVADRAMFGGPPFVVWKCCQRFCFFALETLPPIFQQSRFPAWFPRHFSYHLPLKYFIYSICTISNYMNYFSYKCGIDTQNGAQKIDKRSKYRRGPIVARPCFIDLRPPSIDMGPSVNKLWACYNRAPIALTHVI
jgi:hypothetical protein